MNREVLERGRLAREFWQSLAAGAMRNGEIRLAPDAWQF